MADRLTFGSICSGIEAASVALEPVGFRAAWLAESAPFPSSVLAHRLPSVPNLGDITRIDTASLDRVDLIIGGTPCQSFSVAGLRQGLSDERGSVTLHFARIVRDLRPAWVLWENVPGALSSSGGRDFAALLGALAGCGYNLGWRVLDARGFGLPQRRRRLYLAGVLGPATGPESVLAYPDSPSWHPSQAGGEGAKDGEHRACANRGVTYWDGSQVTQCLDAVLYKGQALPEKRRFPAVMTPSWQECGCCGEMWCNICAEHVGDCECQPLEDDDDIMRAYGPSMLRYLTPTECERLQGFPAGWTDVPGASKSKRLHAVGNSMAVPVIRHIGQRIAERLGAAWSPV